MNAKPAPPRAPSPQRYSIAPARLKAVLRFMDAHFAEQLSLRDLAKVACRSPWHFNRAFRQAMGFPPYRYLIDRRIEHAKALLRESDATVAEIGRRVGFRSPRHFAAMFQRLVGTSPGRFRHAARPATSTCREGLR